MNGEKSAAKAVRQVVNSWAAEQTEREREVNQIFGMSHPFKFPDSLQGISADILAGHMVKIFGSEEVAWRLQSLS